DLARPSRHGRHRRTTAADTDDPPEPPAGARHRRPEIGPDTPPPPDPLVDTGSTGLRMFNLGTIPASVTPPRSWRRAAWFTVVASVAALAGLLVMGALLVGPARDTGRITALPYFPEGKPLAALGGDDTSSGVPTRARPVTPDSAPVTGGGTGRPVATSDHDWSGYPVTHDRWPATTTHRRAPVAGTRTVVTTVTSAGDPVVDPTKLIKRTRTFFAEVTSDAQAAADLTTGTLHDDAVALIHQRYGDLSSIQIQQISLDPRSGLTVCVVRATGRDGGTHTRRITLQFTPGIDPKIINPGG
ncbi:MAG TPA: hypothetical protein VHV49_18435, partial [Pseudonocardiaceae bacterium]|nr:hypothetical protein [Pseudonocardiaceae bacterium]